MLVLKRKEGQVIEVGSDIKIILKEIRRGHVKIMISAPDDVQIKRADSENQIKLENKRAAACDLNQLESPLIKRVVEKTATRA